MRGIAPDGEGAVRAWLRALALPNLAARAFFGVPRKPTYPLVVVTRVGGAPSSGDSPIDEPMIQLDVWGEKPDSKAQVASVAYRIAGEIENLPSGTQMGVDAASAGASVESGPVWSPDPESGQARYVITAVFGIRGFVAAP